MQVLFDGIRKCDGMIRYTHKSPCDAIDTNNRLLKLIGFVSQKPFCHRNGAARHLSLFYHLGRFGRWRLRRRTPGPPPFSSMNSIPAFSMAALIFSAVSARPAISPSADSSLAIVGSETDEWRAKSPCDHPSKARAALTCRIVTKFV
jgi:hypothetical protein